MKNIAIWLAEILGFAFLGAMGGEYLDPPDGALLGASAGVFAFLCIHLFATLRPRSEL